MQLGKILKWGASSIRVAAAKVRLGSKLQLPHGGKPVYLGRGVRLKAEPNGCITLGVGAYIDDYSRLEVGSGASMRTGNHVYMNTNVRAVAAARIEIGAFTMFGPNACVYDHDHLFDVEGVHAGLKVSPISIGEHCWFGANSLVTRGVTISDRILVGGGCVVTCPLLEPGVYAGIPAHAVRSVTPTGRGVGGVRESRGRNCTPQDVQCSVPSRYQGSSSEGAQGS